MRTPSVTVGIFLRERFAATGITLRSVVAHTPESVTLVIVDCGLPAPYLQEAQEAVEGRTDVRWIRSGRFLHVNESRNLIAAATDDDYVCMLENAAVVSPGWLTAMVSACEEFPAGAATPALFEKGPVQDVPHHDFGFSRLEVLEDGDGIRRTCLADLPDRAARFAAATPVRVSAVEGHCNFFRRETLRLLGQFDEAIVAGTHVDISCALQEKGVVVIQVPASKVLHMPVVWLQDAEKDFYSFRWDVEKITESRRLIERKWNLSRMAAIDEFARAQARRVNPFSWYASRFALLPRHVIRRYFAGKERA